MSRLIPLLIGLIVVLAFVVGLELQPDSLDDGEMSSSPASSPVMKAVTPANAGDDFRQAWVDTALARPLFFPDRRPAADAAPRAAAPSLPRLTGILLYGPNRRVIFAGVEGGRARVVAEGGEVDGYRLQTIEAGGVTLTGRDGSHTIRPAFDKSRPAPAVSAPGTAANGLPNLSGLTGIPGLPVAR